jgi:pilus assembly protein CpaE
MFATRIDVNHAESAAPLDTCHIPKLAIAAFCATPDVGDAVAAAAADRRMMRAKVEIATGATRSAVEQFRHEPSPDLIILERQVPGDLLLEELDRLAEVCDVGTKVLVIGVSNDIALYRELLSRGISEYLVAPVDAAALIGAIGRIYASKEAKKLGRSYAFVGAKGGVGSSTVCHNVAASMARRLAADVIMADLDLAFGTCGLDFNLDVAQGVAEAIESAARLDELLLERLLGKCDERLSMLAAPVTLDRAYDLDEAALDEMLDIARASAPHLVLDVPHLWTGWARRRLVAADEVIIIAAPDLANLRNAKMLVELLRRERPHDAPPRLVLNQVGMARRPEIKAADFARSLQIEPSAVVPFNARLFGAAANKGQMVAEVSRKAAAPFDALAEALVGRGPRRGGTSLLRRLMGAR